MSEYGHDDAMRDLEEVTAWNDSRQDAANSRLLGYITSLEEVVGYERGKNDDSLEVVRRLDAALYAERKMSAWLAHAIAGEFPCDGAGSSNLDPGYWLAAAREATR
jgi:hypothetical protein